MYAAWHRPMRAHPRSRGENTIKPLARERLQGSSPLTRGKRFYSWAASVRPGLIPAHAGKTERSDAPGAGQQAHPRSRGENDTTTARAAAGMGSSPLTRGKHPQWIKDLIRLGLIPAHAGKTRRGRRRRRSARAHPRSRGENTIAFDREKAARGSSPLTRGKP